MLKGKNILVGITGGIAAYKSAYIVRLLVKADAHVKVVMTASATDFITPLTLSTLSKNPVYHTFFNKETGEWHSHVDLAEWADIFLIAPLTASTMAKMVHGQSDNLLLATYLSFDKLRVLAPAMDLKMYQYPATRNNLEQLKNWGHHVIPAKDGELASGLCGEGRMAEPEDIVHYLNSILKKQ